MAGAKCSEEFKEQIVTEAIEKSGSVSEVKKACGLVPQTVGNCVNKWLRTHRDGGGIELASAELAEVKKVKAELREAQMEIEFLKKQRPSSPGSAGSRQVRRQCQVVEATRSRWKASRGVR
ncbi:transposase [Arachnia propionica]|nr:transposase [Arachnia propionica]